MSMPIDVHVSTSSDTSPGLSSSPIPRATLKKKKHSNSPQPMHPNSTIHPVQVPISPPTSSSGTPEKVSLRSRFGSAIRRRSTSAMDHWRSNSHTVLESGHGPKPGQGIDSVSPSTSWFFIHPKESYRRMRSKSSGRRERLVGLQSEVASPTVNVSEVEHGVEKRVLNVEEKEAMGSGSWSGAGNGEVGYDGGAVLGRVSSESFVPEVDLGPTLPAYPSTPHISDFESGKDPLQLITTLDSEILVPLPISSHADEFLNSDTSADEVVSPYSGLKMPSVDEQHKEPEHSSDNPSLVFSPSVDVRPSPEHEQETFEADTPSMRLLAAGGSSNSFFFRKLPFDLRQAALILPTAFIISSPPLDVLRGLFSHGERIRQTTVDLFATSFDFKPPYSYLEDSRNGKEPGGIGHRSEHGVLLKTQGEDTTVLKQGVSALSIGMAASAAILGAHWCSSFAWSLSKRLHLLHPAAFSMVPGLPRCASAHAQYAAK